MQETYQGFDVGKVTIGLLKLLKERGILEEKAILDLLWEAKDPLFPWTKEEIKDLLQL